MKKIIVLMLIIYVVAIAGFFYIDGPDGKPIATMEQTKNLASEKLESITGLVNFNSLSTTSSDLLGSGSAGVYRWKSANGTWVYGDSPPDKNKAELVSIDTESNILPSELPAAPDRDDSTFLDNEGLSNIPVIGTVDATKKIKRQLRDLEAQIQARDAQMK